MNKLLVLKQPHIALPLAAIVGLVIYDFVARVYTPLNRTESSEVDWSYVIAPPAEAAELPESLQSWMAATDPSTQTEPRKTKPQGIPDMPGSEKLGNINVRVRAIFTGADQLAIVEVQQPGSRPQTQVMRENDALGPYIIDQITNQFIVLNLNSEAKAVAESSNGTLERPRHLYVFEPSKKNR